MDGHIAKKLITLSILGYETATDAPKMDGHVAKKLMTLSIIGTKPPRTQIDDNFSYLAGSSDIVFLHEKTTA